MLRTGSQKEKLALSCFLCFTDFCPETKPPVSWVVVYLVLTENYYSGWRVYVNGSEKNIIRVNYNLRGVVVPQGESMVSIP